MAVEIAPPLTIDLSRQPLPSALLPLDIDAIMAERETKLIEVFTAAGLPYNSFKRSSDPARRLQEVDAYRELNDKITINKTIRAVMPAFARGADLDAIVARANVQRLIVTPANPDTGAAAILESDANLLRRYLASFGRPAAGSEDAYISLILEAWPQVHDVRPLGREFHGRAGRVEVVVLAPEGRDPTPEELLTARLALRSKRSVPMTDDIVVRGARILRYTMQAHLVIPRGPDPELVKADAASRLQALADERYFVGGLLPANAVPAGLYVPNVVRAYAQLPALDVGGALDAAPFCEAVNVTHEVLT